MIVAIEGIDGAGKNTLTQALVEHFGRTKVVRQLAFPQYESSIYAHLASKALYGQMGDLIDSAHGMATLFALDRHSAAEVLREYAPGGRRADEVLLLDRYIASNAAYTGVRLGDLEGAAAWIHDLEIVSLGLPAPTLQVLLATAPDLAKERAAGREETDESRVRDSYEKNDQLQRDTAQCYAGLAERQWVSPWLVVAPQDDPRAVASRIAAICDVG